MVGRRAISGERSGPVLMVFGTSSVKTTGRRPVPYRVRPARNPLFFPGAFSLFWIIALAGTYLFTPDNRDIILRTVQAARRRGGKRT